MEIFKSLLQLTFNGFKVYMNEALYKQLTTVKRDSLAIEFKFHKGTHNRLVDAVWVNVVNLSCKEIKKGMFIYYDPTQLSCLGTEYDRWYFGDYSTTFEIIKK